MEIFRNKYRLVILKPLLSMGKGEEAKGLYEQVKMLRVSIDQASKVWRGQTYYYDPSEISYRKGRTYFIYKEMDSGDTVFRWGRVFASVSPNDVTQKNKANLMNKALSTNPYDVGLLTLIVTAVAALCGGLVIMAVAYPTVFPDMVKMVLLCH